MVENEKMGSAVCLGLIIFVLLCLILPLSTVLEFIGGVVIIFFFAAFVSGIADRFRFMFCKERQKFNKSVDNFDWERAKQCLLNLLEGKLSDYNRINLLTELSYVEPENIQLHLDMLDKYKECYSINHYKILRAHFLCKLNDFEQARVLYEELKSCKLKPFERFMMSTLELILMLVEKRSEEECLLFCADSLKKDRYGYYLALYRVYKEFDKIDECIDALEQCVKYAPARVFKNRMICDLNKYKNDNGRK